MTDEVAVVSEVKPLSEIFGAKPEAAPPAKVDDQKPAADQAKGENDGGTPPPKAEDVKPDASKPAPKDDDPIKVMRKALNKTQRELAQLRQEKQTPPPAAPDPIVDADGFSEHIRRTVSETVWAERIADAEEELVEKLGDGLDDTIDAFKSMMEARPQLFNEWRASRNPAKFIIKAVEEHKTRAEMGDPAAYAEKIRADTRKEMAAEVERMVSEGIKKALGQHLPQSLADEQRQGGSRNDPAPTEFRRKPLDQILKK